MDQLMETSVARQFERLPPAFDRSRDVLAGIDDA